MTCSLCRYVAAESWESQAIPPTSMLVEINKNSISGAPRIFENMTVRLLYKDVIQFKYHILFNNFMCCMMPRAKRSKRYIQPTHMEQCYIKSKISNCFDIVHSVQYNMMCKYTALLTQYRQVKGN